MHASCIHNDIIQLHNKPMKSIFFTVGHRYFSNKIQLKLFTCDCDEISSSRCCFINMTDEPLQTYIIHLYNMRILYKWFMFIIYNDTDKTSFTGYFLVQWNPFTKATFRSKPKWPLQRGSLYRGVHLVRKVVMQADSTDLYRRVGLSRGWPL